MSPNSGGDGTAIAGGGDDTAVAGDSKDTTGVEMESTSMESVPLNASRHRSRGRWVALGGMNVKRRPHSFRICCREVDVFVACPPRVSFFRRPRIKGLPLSSALMAGCSWADGRVPSVVVLRVIEQLF